MKKLLILGLCLVSGCSFIKDKSIVGMLDITTDHLEHVEICAMEKKFNYEGSENKTSILIREWFDNVIELDKNCSNTIEFNLQECELKRTELVEEIRYENKILSNISVYSPGALVSKARAKVHNVIKYDAESTLAEKERYLMKLNEKSINDFDRVMKASIEKYIK